MNRTNRTNHKLKVIVRSICLASLPVVAALSQAQMMDPGASPKNPDERFVEFIRRVNALSDSGSRNLAIHDYVQKLIDRGGPVIEDTTIYFVYYGSALRVGVPGDLNRWTPDADMMTRVGGTNLFYLAKSVNRASRFEYKLVIDSTWILDPLNKRWTRGGFGPNSEIWMPDYLPPKDIDNRPDIAHGSIDTLAITSAILQRTYPVLIYLPPGYKNGGQRYPALFVNDGGEYLSLASVNNVIDNLIADGRIPPIIGVFVDPRTDPGDSRTNQRLTDYAMNDKYNSFLIDEVRAQLLKSYSLDTVANSTAIMGASFGGLSATYAAYCRPDVFGLCAAQSPSYQYNHDAMITLVAKDKKVPVRFYLHTGTIHDAQEKTRVMSKVLKEKGYDFLYAESPESHNWYNWRARIANILIHLWGKQK